MSMPLSRRSSALDPPRNNARPPKSLGIDTPQLMACAKMSSEALKLLAIIASLIGMRLSPAVVPLVWQKCFTSPGHSTSGSAPSTMRCT